MWRELCWKNVIRFFITPSQKNTKGRVLAAGDYVGETYVWGGGCQNLTPYRQNIKRNLETVFEVEIVLIVNLYTWVR